MLLIQKNKLALFLFFSIYGNFRYYLITFDRHFCTRQIRHLRRLFI